MRVNGEQYDYEAQSVSDLLGKLSIDGKAVIAEVDGTIVAQKEFETYIVDKEAIVELVAFVGGG